MSIIIPANSAVGGGFGVDNSVRYNGSNATGITGVGFQPDWVWCKQRDGADNHVLGDSVRGGNKQIYSNLTNAETSSTDMLQSFNSDGFTLGTDGAVNRNGNTNASIVTGKHICT